MVKQEKVVIVFLPFYMLYYKKYRQLLRSVTGYGLPVQEPLVFKQNMPVASHKHKTSKEVQVTNTEIPTQNTMSNIGFRRILIYLFFQYGDNVMAAEGFCVKWQFTHIQNYDC